mmetsp:Transcript_12869/g.45344  ORF Transcript_12869/g.45344 Transcript_12869/m.45344 type:complete len:243 (+) Transcript_12869:192-920(+)
MVLARRQEPQPVGRDKAEAAESGPVAVDLEHPRRAVCDVDERDGPGCLGVEENVRVVEPERAVPAVGRDLEDADARACVPDVRLVRVARGDREARGGDVAGEDMGMRVRLELPPCGAVPGDAELGAVVFGGDDEDARRVDGDGPQNAVVEEREGVALEVARRRVEQRDAFLAADGDRRARVAGRREDGADRISAEVEPGAGLRPEVPKGRAGAREREDAAAAKLGVDNDDGVVPGEAAPRAV